MNSRTSWIAELSVALVAGMARADDAPTTGTHAEKHDAAHTAMHDAMQKQMAAPPASAHMPGTVDHLKDDATAARAHAAQMQQKGAAARQRAIQQGAHDAAVARGAAHGGTQTGSSHGGAALPETLLDAELFGFEKGAFTGATSASPGTWPPRTGARSSSTRSARSHPPRR